MKSVFNFFGELIKIIIVALIIVLPIRYFLVQPFFVNGESMEPNFVNNEYLLIDEISYRFGGPQRGDVIVFHYPRDPTQYFIKRVIGLPGERVVEKNGTISIYSPEHPDGFALDERPYLRGKGKMIGTFDVPVGKNDYFVLGDNRDKSFDSRAWGMVPRNLIVGKVWLVVWPFSKAEVFSDPIYATH